jgi:hypothetical protein
VARMGERTCAYGVLVGKPEEGKDHLEDIDEDGKTILKRILNGLGGV